MKIVMEEVTLVKNRMSSSRSYQVNDKAIKPSKKKLQPTLALGQ